MTRTNEKNNKTYSWYCRYRSEGEKFNLIQKWNIKNVKMCQLECEKPTNAKNAQEYICTKY